MAEYSYLADGSKSKAENGSGVGLVYRGSLIYRKAADGSLSLEGASLPEGRLTVNGVRWHVKDHLGSVRAVVDGSTGNLLAVTDYDAYGEGAANSTASPYLSPAPSGETFRERFTGKEDQGPDFGTAYTDFGARQYSPTLRRWLVPDPLSEKYYGISPYAYCAGNPVNLVDLDGNSYSEFDINGNYIQTTKDNWWHNFWHGRTGRIVDGNGNVVQSFRFADPKHYVDDLKKGKINRIQVVQEDEIISMLSKAGAFSEENKVYNNDIVDRYAYILEESPNGGKFDFALTGIPTLYNNYDQSLFLVNGVAHNKYNYGNFLWGAAGKALGLTLLELRAGAHFRALVQNGEDGYPSQFDSRDDQISIREGVKYANAHNYKNVFYRVAVGSLKIVGNVY